tara:strand:- start:308 stop:469 length:162 start_codon:yes stop_codon:yes gene_type:complete
MPEKIYDKNIDANIGNNIVRKIPKKLFLYFDFSNLDEKKKINAIFIYLYYCTK